MKKTEDKLEVFQNLVEAYTSKERQAYEDSRRIYEKTLKKFIIEQISSKKRFSSFYKDAHASLCDSLRHEKGTIAIDELMVLETIINDQESYIENYGCDK